jgi:hypothetical protein
MKSLFNKKLKSNFKNFLTKNSIKGFDKGYVEKSVSLKHISLLNYIETKRKWIKIHLHFNKTIHIFKYYTFLKTYGQHAFDKDEFVVF